MAIDTAAKRRRAVATRRLPWFRRFASPIADGAVSQPDRQQLALVYSGAGEGGGAGDSYRAGGRGLPTTPTGYRFQKSKPADDGDEELLAVLMGWWKGQHR